MVVVTATGLARMIGGSLRQRRQTGKMSRWHPTWCRDVVPPGASARQIGNILAEAGVIRSANEFELEVRDQAIANQLRAGSYQLVTGMDIDAVLPVLFGVRSPTPIVTIPRASGCRR